MTNDARIAALERRIDGLVNATAQEQTWGKALYRQFEQHCRDDEARHKENVETLKEAVAAASATAAALGTLNENFGIMLPMMRRLRAKEVFRRSVVQCLSRWRHIVVGLGISAAGLFVWLDGHWPKIAAVFRKLGGAP